MLSFDRPLVFCVATNQCSLPSHDNILAKQKVDNKLRTLERTNFGKGSPIRVAVVGCGYAGVELAATVAERLQDGGIVQAINVDTTICPTAPPGNREAALKVSCLEFGFHVS